MKRIVLILFAAALGVARGQQTPAPGVPAAGDAATSQAEMRAIRDRLWSQSTVSGSGQFVVFASAAADQRSRAASAAAAGNHFALDPRLLVISCERIKESLWRTLGATAPWQGGIRISLQRARSADDPITLVAERLQSRWGYRLSLPDSLEQGRFVRTIVDVLLLEMANRNAGARSAEIPTWLAEGLAQQLMATDGVAFLLSPPDAIENGVQISRMTVDLTDAPATPGMATRKLNPLAAVQETLRSRPPLSFEQLSWPTTELLSGEAGATYRCSAQLFVDQLLQLRNGPACFRALLNELPRHYNWQVAFLAGFRQHFQRLLDVEKWWALQLVQFAGRDLMRTWTPEESWQKLDEIVRSQIEVRTGRQDLPLRTAVTLQTIIREWDTVRQTQALERKLQELNLLRQRVSQNLVQLVDEYRDVLGTYLQKRAGSGRLLPFNKAAGPIVDRLAQTTIRQLDALDAKRAALRPATPAPMAATQPSVPETR